MEIAIHCQNKHKKESCTKRCTRLSDTNSYLWLLQESLFAERNLQANGKNRDGDFLNHFTHLFLYFLGLFDFTLVRIRLISMERTKFMLTITIVTWNHNFLNNKNKKVYNFDILLRSIPLSIIKNSVDGVFLSLAHFRYHNHVSITSLPPKQNPSQKASSNIRSKYSSEQSIYF